MSGQAKAIAATLAVIFVVVLALHALVRAALEAT